MNENTQDIDLNNDVVNETNTDIDDVSAELEELRAYKAEQEEARLQAERNREAAKRRLAQKQPTNTNVNNTVLKDIAEIKFARKIDTFAEENGLTRTQAERILKLEPNATADTLKDPFYAEGLKAIARKERVENATPGASSQVSVNGKSFKDMTPDERKANFSKFTGAGN
jgi:hypothetical protein